MVIANKYDRSDPQFLRTTTIIKLGSENFEESRLTKTFYTIFTI